jgi:putative heme degradation protein
VADNSLVNWLPTLAGMIYENNAQQIGVSKEFNSDFNRRHIDLETVPFIWKHMKSRHYFQNLHKNAKMLKNSNFDYRQCDIME